MISQVIVLSHDAPSEGVEEFQAYIDGGLLDLFPLAIGVGAQEVLYWGLVLVPWSYPCPCCYRA